jgi:hypothetical protein
MHIFPITRSLFFFNYYFKINFFPMTSLTIYEMILFIFYAKKVKGVVDEKC